jgi:hypothetical protein
MEGSDMSKSTIEGLLKLVEGATTLEADVLAKSAATVREVFPNAPHHPEVLAEPVEAVLHLVDRCLPHWTIQLTGKAQEPDGHWHCSLRESSTSDEDEVIGLGSGPTVALAMLQALLRVARQKAPS